MSAVEDRLAATLAKHGMTARSYGWVCDCGITVTESPRRFEALPLHAAHLAAVVVWDSEPGIVSFEWEGRGGEEFAPHEARDFAAALLAAAKAAEAVTSDGE